MGERVHNKKNPQRDVYDLIWMLMLSGCTLAMIIAQFIVSPGIVSSPASVYDYLIKMIMSIISVGLVAAPVTLVMIAGDLDLSVGSTITLASAVSCNITAWPLYESNPAMCITLAMIAPLLIGMACGAFNGVLIGYLKLSPFITTLGTMYIISTLAIAYNGGAYENGRSSSGAYAFLGRGSLLGVPIPIILLITTFVGFGFLLHRTVYGRSVYSVGGNSTASKFSGISVEKVIFIAYTLAGAMAGLSGLFLSSWTMSADMSVGKSKEFDVISAIILGGASLSGGKGTMLGTTLGVVFMGVLRMFYVQFSISPTYQFLVQGLILMGVVLLNNYIEMLRGKRGS